MFSFSEVYNMPIYLRKFYFKRLQKHYKEQNEEMKKANQKNKVKLNSFNISQQSGNLIKTIQEALGSIREILIYKFIEPASRRPSQSVGLLQIVRSSLQDLVS